MKVFLDDVRTAPVGWIRVYWPDEAIELLKTGNVKEISLDHDLGDDKRGTGYKVLLWIEEAVFTSNFQPPKIKIHTANSAARLKMQLAIDKINSKSFDE
jgi:NAD+-processing family protein with receiver domain